MLRSTPEFKKFNRTYVESAEKVEDSFNNLIDGDGEVNLESLLEETDKFSVRAVMEHIFLKCFME